MNLFLLVLVVLLVHENVQTGWVVEDEDEDENEEEEWPGSWKASIRFRACIGTMNPGARNLFRFRWRVGAVAE